MKISETLVFPSENGCQKIFGGFFLMIYLSITVYIDTKNAYKWLKYKEKWDFLFYDVLFVCNLSFHYCIYNNKKSGSNLYISYQKWDFSKSKHS